MAAAWVTTCLEADPEDRWRCLLPKDHDGPHGWESTDSAEDVQRDFAIIVTAQRQRITDLEADLAALGQENQRLRDALRDAVWKGWSEPLEQLVAEEGGAVDLDDWYGCVGCGSPRGFEMHHAECPVDALLNLGSGGG